MPITISLISLKMVWNYPVVRGNLPVKFTVKVAGFAWYDRASKSITIKAYFYANLG
jgi:hypothetical protein